MNGSHSQEFEGIAHVIKRSFEKLFVQQYIERNCRFVYFEAFSSFRRYCRKH